MAKRPLSVQLRPLSAVQPTTSSHDGSGSSWSSRRLSMGDIIVDQQRVSSDSATGLQEGHQTSVGRRPADLSIIAPGCSAAVTRRRDRCSPSTCKRPIVMTLPRLDLSLIQESSLWTDGGEPASQGVGQVQTPSRDSRVPCRCSTPSLPLNTSASSSSSSSSRPCECLGAGHASLNTPSSSATLASESSSQSSVEPTSILPFLYLGSQTDALSSDVISKNGIEYVVNVSATCPQSPYVAESNFLRIPVNDGHQDRLLPFFTDVFNFLDAVRESSGRVLVHCLAGISRSPTIVIAYVMHHLRLSIDDAYRYVKEKRPSISPNFNFLGQLVEFDSQLTNQRASTSLVPSSDVTYDVNSEAPERAPSPSKRPCMVNLSRGVQSQRSLTQRAGVVMVQSPTTALSRLQFVDQRQTSSTAAVNVLPKSTADDGLIRQGSPAFQSKSTAADTSAAVLQPYEQQATSSSVTWSQQLPSKTCKGETLSANGDAEHAAEVNSASRTSDVLLVDWQTSFKSRSLEDILLVSTSPPRSLSHGQGHVTSHWTPANEDHDESRLAGHAPLTTSHGSVRTSHASLHGSLEMIQVS